MNSFLYFIVVLTLLFSTIFLFNLIIFHVDYSVHKSMTTKYASIWDYGTFDQFVKEFDSRDWKRDEFYEESFFGDYEGGEHKSQIHASIVVFDKKGMVLKIKDYRKYKKFLEKNSICGKNRRKAGIWK